MATTNITKQFKSLLPESLRFRGEVLVVDSALERVKIQWGNSQLWVTSTSTLSVGDQVLVEDNKVTSKLPSLNYAQVSIS